MEEGKEAIKTEEIITTESSGKVSFTGQHNGEHKKIKTEEKPEEKKPKGPRKSLWTIWGEFYEKNYKKLIFVSILPLLISILFIGVKFVTTGDFINKDISLKGGVTVSIPTKQELLVGDLEEALQNQFPKHDMAVRSLKDAGKQIGMTVTADIDGGDKGQLDALLDGIRRNTNLQLKEGEYSVEIVGSSLGASFFRETIIALLIAFLFMAITVILYFRLFMPSLTVILSALSDILETLFIVNLLGMKIGTAGIAAFLMVIGYSVDNNLVLATRMLKRKEGNTIERYLSAMKTGLTMSLTTLGAASIGAIFTQSEVIRQIMIILMISQITDILNTWVQNGALLMWYKNRGTS